MSAKNRRKTLTGRLPKLIDRLHAKEARWLLRELLLRHPELRDEAADLAEKNLRQVKPEDVAHDVEAMIRILDLDDLNRRAGPTRWGYTDPSDAAWEILQDAIQPYLDDLRRYLEMGLEEPAVAVCSGIILGLYQVEEKHEAELVSCYAPDFPSEAAFQAAEILAGKDRQRRLPQGILDQLPTWASRLARITG